MLSPLSSVDGSSSNIRDSLNRGVDYLISRNGSRGKAGSKFRLVDAQSATLESIIGMALLSSGSTPDEGPYAKEIKSHIDYIVNLKITPVKDRKDGYMENWSCGFMLMYLSQISALGQKQKVAPLINSLIAMCEEAQYDNGGWTHGKTGKNKLNYDHLAAPTLVIMNGLGLAKQAGYKIPQHMIDKSMEYIKNCTSGNKVGYSPRKGQKGMEFSTPFRNPAAYAAFIRFGREDEFTKQIMPTLKMVNKVGDCHASGDMPYLFMGLCVNYIKGDVWDTFRSNYIPNIIQSQRENGSFRPLPRTGKEKEIKGVGEKGKWHRWHTALNCIVLGLTLDHDQLLWDFSRNTINELSQYHLKNVAAILGKDTPDSLNNLIKEAETINNSVVTTGSKNKVDLARKKANLSIKKLFNENVNQIIFDIKKNDNQSVVIKALNHLIGFTVKLKGEYTKKGTLSHLLVSTNALISGKAKCQLSFNFTNDEILRPIRDTTFSIYDSKAYTKKVTLSLKDKTAKEIVINVKFNLEYAENTIEFTKKVKLDINR